MTNSRYRRWRLLRRFDRLVNRARSSERWPTEILDARTIAETRAQYEQLIPQLPYIGGRSNHLSGNLESSLLYLALWRVLERRGWSESEIGALFIDVTEAWLSAYPPSWWRILGKVRFTRSYRWMLTRMARRSHRRRYPGDFVFDVTPRSESELGVDYTECGILKFFSSQGAASAVPILCRLDYPMCRAMGIHLKRSGTLAEGAPRCDFRMSPLSSRPTV